MGKLAEDMTRLGEEMRALHENRRECLVEVRRSVQELRETVESTLESARGGRLVASDQARRSRQEFREELCSQVEQIELDAQGLRARSRRELREAAKAGKSEREAFVRTLQERVRELRGEAGALLERIRDRRSEMAEQTRRGLNESLCALQREVTEFCAGFREARQEMAQTSAAQRAAFLSEIAEIVEGLRKEVASDLKEGRRALLGPSPAEARALRERRRSEGERSAEPEKARPHPDDLTAISDIGLRMQERLNQAGIYTYAQLSARGPEDLCKAFEELPAVTMEKANRWVTQARELAGK